MNDWQVKDAKFTLLVNLIGGYFPALVLPLDKVWRNINIEMTAKFSLKCGFIDPKNTKF